MKINQIIAFLGFFSFATLFSNLHAQTDVTISPINLLWGDISLAVDQRVTDNISMELAVGLNQGKKSGYKRLAVPATLTAKYYFNPKTSADGFYADAFLRYINRNYTVDGDTLGRADYSQRRFGLGFGIGYKAASQKGFVFDIGVGMGRAIFDNTEIDSSDDDITTVNWPKIMPVGRIGIGYRFGRGGYDQ